MPASLMSGEESIALVRQHWSVVAAPVLAAAVIIIAALVLLVALPDRIASVGVHSVKLIAALVVIAAAAVWAGFRVIRWRFTTYHLTDRRIVMEAGVLSRVAETIPLDRIQNTVIHRPLGDRLIGAGDIEIESAGRDGVEVLHRIPRAEAFYTSLLQAMNPDPGAQGTVARPQGV